MVVADEKGAYLISPVEGDNQKKKISGVVPEGDASASATKVMLIGKMMMSWSTN